MFSAFANFRVALPLIVYHWVSWLPLTKIPNQRLVSHNHIFTQVRSSRRLFQIHIINNSRMASRPRLRQGLPINVVNVMREPRVSHNSGHSHYLSIKSPFIIIFFGSFNVLSFIIILYTCLVMVCNTDQ